MQVIKQFPIQVSLGVKLRAEFDGIAREPLPRRLLDLIHALSERTQGGAPSEPN
jgi:hypothetical protein